MSDIWFQRPTPEELNRVHLDTACEALGIEITEVGDDYLRGTMPVDKRTVQPIGLLHGGASLLLAETLGSAAAMCTVDRDKWFCVGTTITANHIRAAAKGPVLGTAKAIHLGRTSQLWEIDIIDPDGKSICLSRLTTNVVQLDRYKP